MTMFGYSTERLLRMLADVITSRFPLNDVKLLLEAGADPNGDVTHGLRPLHYAAYVGRGNAGDDAAESSYINVLVDHGADINCVDNVGYTPLHVAAKAGHLEALRQLIIRGANVNGTCQPQTRDTGSLQAECCSDPASVTVSCRHCSPKEPCSCHSEEPCSCHPEEPSPYHSEGPFCHPEGIDGALEAACNPHICHHMHALEGLRVSSQDYGSKTDCIRSHACCLEPSGHTQEGPSGADCAPQLTVNCHSSCTIMPDQNREHAYANCKECTNADGSLCPPYYTLECPCQSNSILEPGSTNACCRQHAGCDTAEKRITGEDSGEAVDYQSTGDEVHFVNGLVERFMKDAREEAVDGALEGAVGAVVEGVVDGALERVGVAVGSDAVTVAFCATNRSNAIVHGEQDTLTSETRSGDVLPLCSSSESSNEPVISLTDSPLSLAIDSEHIDCVQELLRSGADPNITSFLGSLINTMPLNNIVCLRLVLRYGADPDALSRGGLTPLMKAAKHKQVEAVRVLLEHGANVNIQCPPRFDQRRAIHFATMSGSLEVVQLLLDNGAYTNKPPGYSTPLECAVLHDRPEICSALLSHGAQVDELNDEDSTPLQVACATPSLIHLKDIIDILLIYGAQPNIHSQHFSCTGASLCPLVEYITYNDVLDFSLVKLFLQFGARVHFTVSTRLLKISDASGLLTQLRKLRPHEEIFNLLLDAAQRFDLDAIERETALSNSQRTALLAAATCARLLKQIVRTCIVRSLALARRRQAACDIVRQLPLPEYLQRYILYDI